MRVAGDRVDRRAPIRRHWQGARGNLLIEEAELRPGVARHTGH
jgi:hypothetical protein